MPRSQSRTPVARTSARAAPQRKPRTAKQAKAEHRGGEWGRGVAGRLRTLKGADGVRAFGERVGLSASLVSSYLNGGRLPDAVTLRKLAERTGVSLDWLLLGDGNDAPRYRGQHRNAVALEADIAAYVNRALQQAYAPELAQDGDPADLYTWRVNAAAILADAVTRIQQEEQHGVHETELHGLLLRLSDHLQREAESPADHFRLGSVVNLPTLERLVEGIVAPAYRASNPNPFAARESNVTAYPKLAAVEWGSWRAVGDPLPSSELTVLIVP